MDSTNPYMALRRDGLAEAAMQRAGDLLNPSGQRSAQERADLARDTALLLIALARYADTGRVVMGSPVNSAMEHPQAFADIFREHYAHLVSHARHDTFGLAADLALDRRVAGYVPTNEDLLAGNHYLAARDDAGLSTVLERLQAEYLRRRAARGGS